MVNDFVCSEERIDREYYACAGTLTGLEDNTDNVFYFKCRDTAGNVNDDDQPASGFHLYVTDALSIVDYGPENQEIYANGVTLSIETSGGANGDGSATCYYSPTGFFNVNSIEFENTGGRTHSHTFEELSAGAHSFYAWCEDTAGNDATQLIQFTLLRDETSPELMRIYVDGTRLYVQLSEETTCEYSLEGSFIFGIEGNNPMQSNDGLTHFCQLEENAFYHIICQDSWENPISFVVYP